MDGTRYGQESRMVGEAAHILFNERELLRVLKGQSLQIRVLLGPSSSSKQREYLSTILGTAPGGRRSQESMDGEHLGESVYEPSEY